MFKMSLLRKKRKEIQMENNEEGLISVQQDDGSFMHIPHSEWSELNSEGAANGESEGVTE